MSVKASQEPSIRGRGPNTTPGLQRIPHPPPQIKSIKNSPVETPKRQSFASLVLSFSLRCFGVDGYKDKFCRPIPSTEGDKVFFGVFLMEKLMKILGRGEMPNFLEVLQALNDISDIDWDGVEASQMTILDVLKANRIPNYPVLACSEFCESCD